MTTQLSRENVPANVIDSLNLFRDHGMDCGGFLHSVLCNDLREAVSRADANNLRIIPDIVFLLHNDYPAGMWGSPDRVRGWRQQARKNAGEPSE